MTNEKNLRDLFVATSFDELRTYCDRMLTPRGSDKYNCPNCDSGKGRNGTAAFSIHDENGHGRYKCFACDIHGDIYDLKKLLNDTSDDTSDIAAMQRAAAPPNKKPVEKEIFHPDFLPSATFFTACNGNLSKTEYHRGISLDTLNRFNVGYCENWIQPTSEKMKPSPRLIVPTGDNTYLARDTRQTTKNEYVKLRVGKISGNFFNIECLQNTDKPVFIVEGEIDAMSIIDAGGEAIGILGTGNARAFSQLPLLDGHRFIIALDNDSKDNGTSPGEEAAERLAAAFRLRNIPFLKADTKTLYQNYKDANDALMNNKELFAAAIKDYEAQAEQLHQEQEQQQQEPPKKQKNAPGTARKGKNELSKDYVVTSNNGKVSVLPPALVRAITADHNFLCVRDRGREDVQIFEYTGGYYNLISPDTLRAYAKAYIERVNADALKMKDCDEVAKIIRVGGRSIFPNDLNNDENIINFKNGILHLDTLELTEHSPDINSSVQLNANWDRNKIGKTEVFDSFLETLTNGDTETAKLLMEYMGAVFSNVPGYRFKKFLILYGAGDTGKSQLKAFTEYILGSANHSNIELKRLEDRFGSYAIFGKRLAGTSDMKYVKVSELSTLKQATGGDNIFAERKGQDGFDFTYKGYFWFCANALPKFGGDQGQWVYDRFIPVLCNNVIPVEKRDRKLLDKLIEERDGIVTACVLKFLEVLKNGTTFTEPPSVVANRKQYAIDNSIELSFFDECCTTVKDKRGHVTAKVLYECYKKYCNDKYYLSRKEFTQKAAEYIGTTYENATFKDSHDHLIRYKNLTLTIEAKQEYHYPDQIEKNDV